jgi:hypothetical protein
LAVTVGVRRDQFRRQIGKPFDASFRGPPLDEWVPAFGVAGFA